MLPFVAVALDQANLDRVVSKMEQDILELASQIEALYQERCDTEAFFGGESGAFPGRTYSTCGSYDPRKRPW